MDDGGNQILTTENPALGTFWKGIEIRGLLNGSR